jgi:uracil-DNA glycosylase
VLEETPTPLQEDTACRSTPRLSACKPFSAFLSERGIAEGTYSHGYCCACDTPNNRRPTRSEVASCSRWLALNFASQYNPHLVLAVGAVAAAMFYTGNTLTSAIERARVLGYRPDIQLVTDITFYVVPIPQIGSLSYHRRSIDQKPWTEIAEEQISIAMVLLSNKQPHPHPHPHPI